MELILDSENQMNVENIVNMPEEGRIRRPPNAFMIFGKQYRRVLAQKFSDLSNKQISKILGSEWKKMEPNMKSHYHSLAKQVYETHLQKYPDYHYNPLEARQRKAERKRKYKTSRVSHKSKVSSQLIFPVIKPFGGNRSLSLPNTSFAFSQSPTIRFVQPIIDNGNGDSVIGIKKMNGFTEGVPPKVAPIQHIEHNYSVQPKIEDKFCENIKIEPNFEPQINEIEVKTENSNNEIDWNQCFDFLVNFLPPMHNPNIGVTPVYQNCDQSLTEFSGYRIEGIKQEMDFNELMNEYQAIDLSQVIKKEMTDPEINQNYSQ